MAKRETLQLIRVPERMSLMDRVRSYFLGPFSSTAHQGWLSTARPTSSGVAVNEWTVMNYSAVWCAVSLVAGDVASLPLKLYKRLPNGGSDSFEDHPLYRLLHDAPNPEMSSMNWRSAMQGHAMVWGNAYTEIERDMAGRPLNLWPIAPDRVQPFRSQARAPLQYRVVNPNGNIEVINANNILHFRGLSYDGISGYEVMHRMRESIGLALAAEQFGAEFFGNGSTFGGVITYQGDPSEQSKKNTREALERRHQGVANAHKFLALYGGAKFEAIGVPPNHAQFQELRTFQVREAARWFKIPPHKLADLADATFSNVEQQNLDYYTSCLRPWLTLWEQELGRKLIAPLERKQQFIKHVVEDLLRADAAGRGQFYAQRFNIASITPNEIRGHENDDPIVGGDRAFIMRNMVPLDRIDDLIDAEIAKATAPSVPVVPGAAQTQGRVDELEKELALARRGKQEAEDAKDIAKAALESARADHLRDLEQFDVAIKVKDETIAEGQRAEQALNKKLDDAKALYTEQANILKTVQADLQDERNLTASLKTDLAINDVELAKRQERIEALSMDVAVETEGRIKAEEQTAEQRMRADAADKRADTADAVIAELRTQATMLAAELQSTQALLLESRDALARVETKAAETDQALKDATTEIDHWTQEVAKREARIIETGGAIKFVLVETIARLLNKETDRARKMQGSPEKLAKWIGDFYPMHADCCRTALKPVLRAWFALNESMPINILPVKLNQLLDETVAAHIDESARQLRGLAAEHDADSLAPALEKLLRKWEADRPELTAERIIRKDASNGAR